ncbi:MAG: hypothetical protein LPD71_00055 [Shewanella sp.]|nr:hypothetical protein [Shewanella sp.]MCF1437194.1 hypothetical protein [Shewanella sp.]MCF1459492.1 hypothetical protein [Shewanella sp.]
MVISAVAPKKPKGKGWEYNGETELFVSLGYPGQYWINRNLELFVISAVESVKDNDHTDPEPVFHVSISKRKGRCSRAEAQFVIKCFDMKGSDEDNHVPGSNVRNFFMPVAENRIGYQCPCKKTENAIVEDKGEYVWRTAR